MKTQNETWNDDVKQEYIYLWTQNKSYIVFYLAGPENEHFNVFQSEIIKVKWYKNNVFQQWFDYCENYKLINIIYIFGSIIYFMWASF